VAPAPGSAPGDFGAQALAVGADGVVARYTSGHGWEREFLQTSSGAVSSPTLRAVAWPEPNRAFAVGDLGAMWIWRAETGLWEKDPAAPLDGFQGNLDGIAFDPSDPGVGYAVGQNGVLLSYGKSWTQEEELPSGFKEANFTSVAFAGSEAMVVTEHDLLVNVGSGWKVEPEVHALLSSLPSIPQLNVVAGTPGGGAVLAGRDVVLERDSAGAPWHFSEQPIVNETAVAAAPLLEGSKVRALLSVVPEFTYPPRLVLPPVDPNTPGPLIPPNPLPGDGYVLRETPAGWEDEERAAYAGDTSDKPIKADPVAGFDVATNGTGWAVGGWSGEADDSGRGSDASGSGQAVRENVQTAGIYSFAPEGNPPGPPGENVAPIPLQGGAATFAVGGHAECVEACSALADVGIAPDRNLSAALGQMDGLSTQPNGPRMLLYTGGRETPGEGPEPAAEADRYAQLLAGGGGLPVYPALSAGDSEGGADAAFGAAFASFNAPFGEGAAPSGVSTANIPAGIATPGPGARTHYALDSTGPAGTVRVIVIDNSQGSLAASDPYQNPAEAQAQHPGDRARQSRAEPQSAAGAERRERRERRGAHHGRRGGVCVPVRTARGKPREPDPLGRVGHDPRVRHGRARLPFRDLRFVHGRSAGCAVRHDRLPARQRRSRQAQPRHECGARRRADDPARTVAVARPGRRDTAAAQLARAVRGHRSQATVRRPLGSGVGLQRQPQPTRR
jgi:hypothetical protein